MKPATSLKHVAASIHAVIGKSPKSTRWYFTLLGSVLRSLPECEFKRQILNSILSARWPDCNLPPRRATLGEKTTVALYPHFGEVGFEILVSRNPLYEREVFFCLEPRLADYDRIIEIGANVGLFSIFFAKAFERLQKPDCQIFVFEPSRKAYLRLLRNIELNAVANIHAFNCAVGGETAFASFYEPDDHLNNGSLLEDFALRFSNSVRVNRTLVVGSELLGPLLAEGRRALIKIDAEGAESRILAGLQRVIVEKTPDILIEVLPMYQDALNKLEFLRTAGYQLFNITDLGLVPRKRFEAGDFRDWLLLSPERAASPCPNGGP